MIKRICILFSMTLLFSTVGFGQKNVIKIRPLSPALGAAINSPVNLPLTYERVLIPRITGSINFSYTLKSDLDLPSLEFGDFKVPTVNSGVSFGPEIRFYPNITKDTPRGFYLSGFFNRSSAGVEGVFNFKTNFEYPIAGSTFNIPYEVDLDYEGTWKSNSYGIAIGSQWIVAKILSIDLQWFGLGWGSTEIAADITGNLIDLNQINSNLQAEAAAYGVAPGLVPTINLGDAAIPSWGDVSNTVGGQGFDIPVLNPTFEASSTANGSSAKVTSNLPNLRMFRFAIGVAF